MDPKYLMQYTARHLRTAVRLYTEKRELLFEAYYADGFADRSWREKILREVPSSAVPKNRPALILVDTASSPVVYAWIPLYTHIYLLGPCQPLDSMEYLYRLSALPAPRLSMTAFRDAKPPMNLHARYLAQLIRTAAGLVPSAEREPLAQPFVSAAPLPDSLAGQDLPHPASPSEAPVPGPSPDGSEPEVFPCTLADLAECTLLLYYWNSSASVTGTGFYLTTADLLAANSTQSEHAKQVWENYNRLLLNNMEHGIIHNPYNQEIREYTAVENGDVEEVKRIQQEDYTARQGILSPDPIRNEINMGIVIITQSRNAAARGGVSPEACYSLSDAAIQEMESCRDISAIRHIARSTQLRYTMLARNAREDRDANRSAPSGQDNRHIIHCKDYIFSHLNRKLTVQQIAEAIGLETNYLSALFHRCENITLKQYILREKISLAKNMLTYSPYSYIEIANYLGFSSQSHMGEQFRRVTGMTMRQYRERYSKEDFLQDVVRNEAR